MGKLEEDSIMLFIIKGLTYFNCIVICQTEIQVDTIISTLQLD